MIENEMVKKSKELIQYNDQIKKLTNDLKELTALRDECNEKLVDIMVDEEVQKIEVNNKTLYLSDKIHANINSDTQNLLFDVLKKRGYADIIKETINASTLSAFCYELTLQNENEMPEWLSEYVSIYTKTKVNVRKS